MIKNLHVQKADIVADWLLIARNRLIDSGFDVSGLASNDEVVRAYFNALMKLTIPVKPRQIYKAADFTCPPVMQAGLQAFEATVLAGNNLRPHMSWQTTKIDNRDGMLYDWGIHHFHLGTTLRPDGFIQRTGPLLYAIVQSDAIYFINVMGHGAWAQQALLQKVYENWPELLKDSIMPGVSAVEQELTDEEIAQMRKANIMVALSVAPGIFVVPPGGGMTASGLSMDVLTEADRLQDLLEEMEQSLKNLTSPFIKQALADGTITKPNLVFKLHDLGGHEYGLQEHTNEFYVKLNGTPNIPPLR